MRGLFATDRYLGGLLDMRSGHLHPLNYTLGLAAAAEAAGVLLFEDSPAVKVEPGEPAVVETANGRVRARYVVLCCNAYLDELVPKLRARIMPVSTYIVATEPLGAERGSSADPRELRTRRRQLGARLLPSLGRPPTAVRRSRQLFRSRSAQHRERHARAHAQGVPATRGHEDRICVGRLRRHLDVPRTGLRPATRPNIYYLQGFSGHGIALTGLAGKLVAEAIAGQAERFDLFTKLRHRDFPGGKALRTPLLVLAMLWFRLKDLL